MHASRSRPNDSQQARFALKPRAAAIFWIVRQRKLNSMQDFWVPCDHENSQNYFSVPHTHHSYPPQFVSSSSLECSRHSVLQCRKRRVARR